MKSKQSTEKMMNQLHSVKDFSAFSNDHEDDFISPSLAAHIQALIEEKTLVKTEVIKRANLDRVYGYQIISGRRMPSRDKLIQLAIGLELDVEGTQTLLKMGGMAPLYAKIKREAAIIFCINKGYTWMETQAFLQQADVRIISE
ncbi:MAG: hypothetical protein APF84_04005 [Gracilibacter sp. BRH_c7a]|nr:MAG: hypothetical protein APF84_04005 [Gracilibacter sp. BRH_c7a]